MGIWLRTSFRPPEWTKDPIIKQPDYNHEDFIIVGSWAGDRVFKELTGPESQYGIDPFPGDSAALGLTIPVDEFDPSNL